MVLCCQTRVQRSRIVGFKMLFQTYTISMADANPTTLLCFSPPHLMDMSTDITPSNEPSSMLINYEEKDRWGVSRGGWTNARLVAIEQSAPRCVVAGLRHATHLVASKHTADDSSGCGHDEKEDHENPLNRRMTQMTDWLWAVVGELRHATRRGRGRGRGRDWWRRHGKARPRKKGIGVLP